MTPSADVNRRRDVILLAAVWSGLVVCLVVAGSMITSSSTVVRFDASVTASALAHRSGASDTVMRLSTWLGAWPALLVLVAVVAVVARRCAATGRRPLTPLLTFAVVAVVGEEAAVRTAKEVVARTRPPSGWWSVSATGWAFPSGHTANAIVWWGVAAFVLAALSGRRPSRAVLGVGVVLVGAVVAVSRVALAVHWTTDVVASAVFAVVWLTAAVVLLGRPAADSVVPGVSQVARVGVPVEDAR